MIYIGTISVGLLLAPLTEWRNKGLSNGLLMAYRKIQAQICLLNFQAMVEPGSGVNECECK